MALAAQLRGKAGPPAASVFSAISSIFGHAVPVAADTGGPKRALNGRPWEFGSPLAVGEVDIGFASDEMHFFRANLDGQRGKRRPRLFPRTDRLLDRSHVVQQGETDELWTNLESAVVRGAVGGDLSHSFKRDSRNGRRHSGARSEASDRHRIHQEDPGIYHAADVRLFAG